MIKIIHLIYIHLLSLFGINKVIKNIQEGEVAHFDIKSVLFVLVSLVYSYLFYILLRTFFSDGYFILCIAFLLSSIFCLLYDFGQVKANLFQSEDTIFLFSLPIGRKEIILSKLFTIYFKNIFFVVLFMASALLAASSFLVINQTFVLLFLVMLLFIPIMPIILASICLYINSYLKMYYPKIGVIIFLFLVCFLFFLLSRVHLTQANIEYFFLKLSHFYSLSYLFSQTLTHLNPFFFVAYLLIHIGVIYLYVSFLSFDYSKIYSMMRGKKKKVSFVYKKRKNKMRFWGMVHKELVHLFSYALYFKSSFYLSFFGSVFLVFAFLTVPFRSYSSFFTYFNLFGPLVLSVLASLGISSIHAFSLERKNLDMLGSFPVSFSQVFFSKLFANFFVVFCFILFDASFLTFIVKPNLFVVVLLYILPIFVSLFHIFLSLLLDAYFIDKKNQNESSIIKERLLPIVPLVLSFSYLVFFFFFPNILGYKYVLGTFLVISFLGIICCIVSYFILKKRLIEKIFYS